MTTDIHHHWINGQWLKGQGNTMQSYNPATMEVIWQGIAAHDELITAAIESAQQAFPTWSNTTPERRYTHLQRYIASLNHHRQSLAWQLSEENGKPLWEAEQEIQAMIDKLAISWQAYQKRTGTQYLHHPGFQSMLAHKPHGTLVVLGPFNFPGHLPNGHMIPALLAGNTIIFKPSEYTPRFGWLLAKCFAEAKLPPGVVNIIQGDVSVGQRLVQAPTAGVLFTGSYQTGKQIHQWHGGQPEKILALEMGGNNPLIISQLTQLEHAIGLIISSAFISTGQRCTCARRLIVTEDVDIDLLRILLVSTMNKLKIGIFSEPTKPFMGPLISPAAVQKARLYIEAWQHQGALILGEQPLPHSNTAWIRSYLLDITHADGFIDEECFAPILTLQMVKDLTQAIEQVQPGDRVELYRSLMIDPKSRRRQMARRKSRPKHS